MKLKLYLLIILSFISQNKCLHEFIAAECEAVGFACFVSDGRTIWHKVTHIPLAVIAKAMDANGDGVTNSLNVLSDVNMHFRPMIYSFTHV
jgi:hypothetical protein